MLTIAIAGCGSRGQDTYAACQDRFPDKMKIVAAADIRPEKLAQMKEKYGLSDDQLYDSAESMLKAGRLADILIVATPDRLHYPQAMEALKLDYHLLLEKPISAVGDECRDIERLALERNREVVVCHVLRYTVFFQKLKELIDTGVVGDVMNIQAIERVGHWHQAHSFVRGNWHSAEETAPMILAKCCHDMDYLLWLAQKRCLRVSSFGALTHFTRENAPEGSAERCVDCRVACPYNAVNFYMGKFSAGKTDWPLNVLVTEFTEEAVMRALQTGPYGKCVYRCDNDVVDHQVVNLELEGGVMINFTMTAFTKECNRQIRIMGTKAEVVGDMENNTITVLPYLGENEVIDVNQLTNDFSGHAGGDARMLEELLDRVEGRVTGAALTSISRSVESHLVALAAEESRLNGGRVVEL